MRSVRQSIGSWHPAWSLKVLRSLRLDGCEICGGRACVQSTPARLRSSRHGRRVQVTRSLLPSFTFAATANSVALAGRPRCLPTSTSVFNLIVQSACNHAQDRGDRLVTSTATRQHARDHGDCSEARQWVFERCQARCGVDRRRPGREFRNVRYLQLLPDQEHDDWGGRHDRHR